MFRTLRICDELTRWLWIVCVCVCVSAKASICMEVWGCVLPCLPKEPSYVSPSNDMPKVFGE